MFKTLLSAAAIVAGVKAADGPALAVIASQDGLTDTTHILVPYIFGFLHDLQLPDVSTSGLTLSKIVVDLPPPDAEAVNITNVAASNAVRLDASRIHMTMHAAFEFKYLFLDVKGNMEVDFINDGLGAHIPLVLSTQPGTHGDDLAPKVTCSGIDLVLNPDNVNITLTGGAVAKIAGILIPLIKNTILPEVIKTVETKGAELINTTLDEDLAKYGTQITIPFLGGVTLDFAQLMGSPKITDDASFMLAVNGTFFDINHAASVPYHPSTFTPTDRQGHMLQVYFTDYVLNTMFAAGFSTGNTLDISYLLSLLNLTITTGELGLVIPQFVQKYGNDTVVNITAAFVDTPSTSSIAPDGQGVTLNVKGNFGCAGDMALGATMDGIRVHAVLSSEAGAIKGKFDTATLGTWKDYSTTLGVSAQDMQAGLQQLVDKYVGIANAALAKGVIIPSIAGITVSDIDIVFKAGLVELGASIVPPQFARAVGELLVWLRDEMVFQKMAAADPEGYRQYMGYDVPQAQDFVF